MFKVILNYIHWSYLPAFRESQVKISSSRTMGRTLYGETDNY